MTVPYTNAIPPTPFSSLFQNTRSINRVFSDINLTEHLHECPRDRCLECQTASGRPRDFVGGIGYGCRCRQIIHEPAGARAREPERRGLGTAVVNFGDRNGRTLCYSAAKCRASNGNARRSTTAARRLMGSPIGMRRSCEVGFHDADKLSPPPCFLAKTVKIDDGIPK
jgi:hypothetical protein